MRSVVWVVVAAVLGSASGHLARRDSERQRLRGSCFADVRFTSHRASTAVACVFCASVVALSARANGDLVVLNHCILVWSGTWLSFVDIDTHTVPRRSQIAVVCAATPVLVLSSSAGAEVSLGGAATGSFAMWGVMKATELLSRGDIGPADAVFAGHLGMFVGARSVSLVPAALVTAFVCAGLVALALLVLCRFGRRSQIPFAPFLFLGSVVAVLR